MPPPTTPAIGEGVCPTDWIEYGAHCYYFSGGSTYKSWDKANEECQQKAGMFHKGTLTSIHNVQENGFIYHTAVENGQKQFSIGLTKKDTGMSPANTKHLYNICTMLGQRRRRWT